MQRVFLQDRGRFKSGELADYPITTWKHFFPGYETYTKALADVLTDLVLLDRRKDRGNGKA